MIKAKPNPRLVGNYEGSKRTIEKVRKEILINQVEQLDCFGGKMKKEYHKFTREQMHFSSRPGTFNLGDLRQLVIDSENMPDDTDIMVDDFLKVDDNTIYFYVLKLRSDEDE